MVLPNSNSLRPADIVEFLRQNSEQGFKKRSYDADSDNRIFERRSALEDALTLYNEGNVPAAKEHVISGVPEAEVERRLSAARAAAKSEGIAEEYARLTDETKKERAMLHDSICAFQAVMARLHEVNLDDNAHLFDSLELVIRKLASQRAGIQIDSTPSAFVRRVEALVDKVGQSVRNLQIRLNSEDFTAILPHLKNSEVVDVERIISDPMLARGDVIVRSDLVRLEDVLAPEILDDGMHLKMPAEAAFKGGK